MLQPSRYVRFAPFATELLHRGGPPTEKKGISGAGYAISFKAKIEDVEVAQPAVLGDHAARSPDRES
jgi:hypothetical protein